VLKPKPCSRIAVVKVNKTETAYIIRITWIAGSAPLLFVATESENGNLRHLVKGTFTQSLIPSILLAVRADQHLSLEDEIFGHLLRQTARTEIVHIDRIVDVTNPALGIPAETCTSRGTKLFKSSIMLNA